MQLRSRTQCLFRQAAEDIVNETGGFVAPNSAGMSPQTHDTLSQEKL